ncbi:uncharacterized protein LOC130746966 isoform X2 [Lotus japonicus]|uniref:uncharacterized protein LOC130746966 isoform X2 n=1 Tax=Lotus japonicus TaxID=34305 RepID=UPI002587C10F|nr:uncharacterized protein LOC130746966 isoform X2 [Lotus japonicus]
MWHMCPVGEPSRPFAIQLVLIDAGVFIFYHLNDYLFLQTFEVIVYSQVYYCLQGQKIEASIRQTMAHHLLSSSFSRFLKRACSELESGGHGFQAGGGIFFTAVRKVIFALHLCCLQRLHLQNFSDETLECSCFEA